MPNWREREMLKVGSAYPNYSAKYRESACTGAILADTFELIRIFPNPDRYMDERIASFQLMTAEVDEHVEDDPRPESYRLRHTTVKAGEKVSRHDERHRWIERCDKHVASVRELRELRAQTGQSLGILKPAEIVGCKVKQRPESERKRWLEAERRVLAQEDMFEFVKPLDFPEAKFNVAWHCQDRTLCCEETPHNMSLNQWGLHELYRKLAGDEDRAEKVTTTMLERLDLERYLVYMFLGSFRSKMFNFGLMDTYSCPREITDQIEMTLGG